ncbi:MAG: UDP-N-acetylglucosamine 1-carboxyvinyltransferase [Oscillospiraceae bacterium]|nr:UDP-N-acetylglucosamine 1-carboxyvinyltransferase [Oscillospiraceae bacterium]
MAGFVIKGGAPLKGEVRVSGAKNAALAIIPAALMCGGKVVLENIPRIRDVEIAAGIVNSLGAKARFDGGGRMSVDSSGLCEDAVRWSEAGKMRASYYFLGALTALFGKASIPVPGGCKIGPRPLDLHVKGLGTLGAKVTQGDGFISAAAERLVGSNVYLDIMSVGATINIMIAAVFAEGTTTIENPAKEPHVVDTANFLSAMGADIKGAGTDLIKVRGVSRLHDGVTYSIIPDQVEAGTFMTAAAATHGEVVVREVIPKHMESLSAKLMEAGVEVEAGDDSIRVAPGRALQAIHIKTSPYPGFPTDLHPQMSALLAAAEGRSTITEGIWEKRFQYVRELNRMEAGISVEGSMAVIRGGAKLAAANVAVHDLRAGAALIIGALAAKGVSRVRGVEPIDRGYEGIETKLAALGADIERVRDKGDK